MVMHNESGKWLKWSEAQAFRRIKAGEQLVVHEFKHPSMTCIWFA
jgi:hypothetical protein